MILDFVLATSFTRRVRGLLFTKPHYKTFVLYPCKSIHTYGMKHALDVAFVDEEGWVLASARGVGPGKILKNTRSSMVFERFSQDSAWPQCGEKVCLTTVNNSLVEEDQGSIYRKRK